VSTPCIGVEAASTALTPDRPQPRQARIAQPYEVAPSVVTHSAMIPVLRDVTDSARSPHRIDRNSQGTSSLAHRQQLISD